MFVLFVITDSNGTFKNRNKQIAVLSSSTDNVRVILYGISLYSIYNNCINYESTVKPGNESWLIKTKMAVSVWGLGRMAPHAVACGPEPCTHCNSHNVGQLKFITASDNWVTHANTCDTVLHSLHLFPCFVSLFLYLYPCLYCNTEYCYYWFGSKYLQSYSDGSRIIQRIDVDCAGTMNQERHIPCFCSLRFSAVSLLTFCKLNLKYCYNGCISNVRPFFHTACLPPFHFLLISFSSLQHTKYALAWWLSKQVFFFFYYSLRRELKNVMGSTYCKEVMWGYSMYKITPINVLKCKYTV